MTDGHENASRELDPPAGQGAHRAPDQRLRLAVPLHGRRPGRHRGRLEHRCRRCQLDDLQPRQGRRRHGRDVTQHRPHPVGRGRGRLDPGGLRRSSPSTTSSEPPRRSDRTAPRPGVRCRHERRPRPGRLARARQPRRGVRRVRPRRGPCLSPSRPASSRPRRPSRRARMPDGPSCRPCRAPPHPPLPPPLRARPPRRDEAVDPLLGQIGVALFWVTVGWWLFFVVRLLGRVARFGFDDTMLIRTIDAGAEETIVAAVLSVARGPAAAPGPGPGRAVAARVGLPGPRRAHA